MAIEDIPLSGIHTNFSVRLKEVEFSWAEQGLSVGGNFLYLSFRDGEITIDEFVKFIQDRLIYYCIPRSERDKAEKEYKETGEYRFITDLHKKAKNLFIQSPKQRDKIGEPAELILFILLEAVLRAPQIVCKMYLKTSTEMPIHGSDAIHVLPGPDGSMYLFWGESKLTAEVSSALDSICASINKFRSPNKAGKIPRDRDIEILTDHMSISDPKQKQEVIDYFDPYNEKSNKRIEVFACLVGAECVYSKLKNVKKEEAEIIFKKEYLEQVRAACNLFAEKIKKNNFSDLRFHFFLLPFDNLDVFRKKFISGLGINANDR